MARRTDDDGDRPTHTSCLSAVRFLAKACIRSFFAASYLTLSSGVGAPSLDIVQDSESEASNNVANGSLSRLKGAGALRQSVGITPDEATPSVYSTYASSHSGVRARPLSLNSTSTTDHNHDLHPLSPSMSSAQPPIPPPENNNEKKPEPEASSSTEAAQDASMDTTPDQPPEETWEDIPEDIRNLPTEDVSTRTRLIDNDLKVCGSMRSPFHSSLEESRSSGQRHCVCSMNRTS